MSKGFSINDILGNGAKPAAPAGQKMQVVMLPAADIEPNPENSIYEIGDVAMLKADIAERGLRSPLEVLPAQGGKYMLLAGHRRWTACRALTAEGVTGFEVLPCVIHQSQGADDDLIALITSNATARELSDGERLRQYIALKQALERKKAAGGLDGRVRDEMSRITGDGTGTLGRLNAIARKCVPEVIAMVEHGEITMTRAYECSKLYKVQQVTFAKNNYALNFYLHNDIKEKLTPGVYYLTIKGLSASVSINFYQVSAFNNDVQNKEIRIVAGKEYSILLAIAKGTAVNGLVVQASLTRNKITSYSPYREQLLTLPTPNGLPGIPVTSGGNYTDPSGQQWVCDEVDLERGVKVQRVKRVDISSLDKSYWDFRSDTGADTSSTRYKNDAVMIDFKSNAPAMNNILPVGVANIKNTFRLVATPLYLYQFNLDASEFPTVKSWTEYLEANTVLVIYALAIPIETPLTPAEIAAYKALTTYAPDTVVQASDDAGIKLCYQRDVNLVVKNLEDAIASMTTT